MLCHITLTAQEGIKLLAARNVAEQHSTNKSQSASVGFSIGTDGFLFNVGASAGRGHADGTDLAWTNTRLSAGNTLTLQSGGDTTLAGAVAGGHRVIADVGGNLTLESLQDTSHLDTKQQNIGASLSIGYGKVGGSFSASGSKMNSDYASVAERTGILTGDGGFQVGVQGHTDLTGAVIASTEQAVQENKNTLTTDSLAMRDIQNEARYAASAYGVSVSMSMNIGGGGGTGAPLANSLTPSGVGLGRDKGSASSTTQSGISGIAGNANVRTLDPKTGIDKIFNADKVQQNINAQVVITQNFNRLSSAAVSKYATQQRAALYVQVKKAGSPEEKAELQQQIKDLNDEERVMNILIGAVSGQLEPSVWKEALSKVAEEAREYTIEDSMKFAGVTDGTTLLTNLSGESEGVRGDGVKVAGTRIDLDKLCGADNKRCKTTIDANGQTQLELKNGQVQWNKEAVNGMTLAAFLETDQGKELYGPTGGLQGWTGTLFGIPYSPKGVIAKVMDAFGGTHDYVGGTLSGLYDEQGNAKRGMSGTERDLYNVWSGVAIVPSAPFAMAELLPPEVWQAIATLLKEAR